MSETAAQEDELARFHEDLLALRAAAGAPSYARLARRTGQPRSTVYDAFRRPSLPSAELLELLVTALDGDAATWRERWTTLRAQADSVDASSTETPLETPESGARTSSDGIGRRSSWRRWVAVPTAAVVGAAAGVLVTRWASDSAAACTSYRVYRANDSGSLLDRQSVERGRIARGDIILVSSIRDHTFHARYPSVDVANGRRGYVDEGKLSFVRDQGCL